MNKSAQLIIGMMLGFEKSHQIFQGVDWDSDMADQLLDAKPITKEDVFSMTPNGKSFFEFKQTWEKLRKLFDHLAKNGHEATANDLTKVMENDKTPIQMAAECNALEDAFAPDLWAGNLDKMEDAWYSIDKKKREGKDFLAMKRTVAQMEGKELREDQLAKAGLEVRVVREAVKGGTLAQSIEKLRARGDHLRLEDALLCDDDGDHVFTLRLSWDNFDKLCLEWKLHGEYPDTEFFQFSRAGRASIIQSAFDHNMQNRVFNKKVFDGRPDEMIRLYNSLSDHHKQLIDLDYVLEQMLEETSVDAVPVDSDLTVERLTDIIYTPPADMKSWKPVIGLGLKKTWDDITKIRGVLKNKGESLSMDDLRSASGLHGESCVLKAAQFDKFHEVLSIMRESGGQLTAEDLLSKQPGRESVLDVLLDKKQLDMLLKPDLWVRNVTTLGKIWDALPDQIKKEKKQAFHEAYTEANILSLRSLNPSTAKPPEPQVTPPILPRGPGGPS